MNINKVTFTGADDSTDPYDLLDLSIEYPFVEWGILVSRSQGGNFRFPSNDWMLKLANITFNYSMNLSMHICGCWVNDILDGMMTCHPLWVFKNKFNRIQLNTHGQKPNVNDKFIDVLKWWNKDIIIQFDNVNSKVLNIALSSCTKVSTLYDLSHGAGILPDLWPKQIPNLYCGYAGGLGPENIKDQLDKLSTIVDDNPIWIDMETKVRNYNDSEFDLNKVRKVIEIVEPYTR